MISSAPHPLLRPAPFDEEKYLLKGSEQIAQTLLELSKRPELINAYFRGGEESITTTVIDVLHERGLVILEPGPNAEKNRQLLEEGNTTCLSKHHDVDIRFELGGLQSARLKGQQVIAAPLPQSLLRLQRREFFRVTTPLMAPILCQLDYEGERWSLPLADISIGGLALFDKERRFDPPNGEILPDCTLILPDNAGEIEVTLEVRASFLYGRDEGHQVRRIGCAFVELPTDKINFIQRYINRLQIKQRN